MGGNAFPGLKIPRLSHEQYNTLLANSSKILQNFYEVVTSPPEAPSKSDHGDIDLLVCNPTHDFKVKELSEALEAVNHTKVGVTTSFALPLAKGQSEEDVGEDEYVQVDVHVCPSEYYEWESLLGGYGDLLQIIGVLNRAAGLTANNVGLHFRIPEIEVYNRKQSMMYLTHSVPRFMQFLGLDYDKYLSGFATDEEIFAWCVAGRFYGPKALEKNNENAADRNRYVKRKMFTRCMNEWLPAHPEVWTNRKIWTREEVQDEAIRFFELEDEYTTMSSAHQKKVAEEKLIEDMRAAVPLPQEAGKRVGEVMKGLKRFVTWQDGHAVWNEAGQEDSIGDKPRWTSLVKEKEKEGLLEWVRANWEEIRRRERERTKLINATNDT
jgi:hypothetical protein